jgi:hypothetical protein
MHHPSHTPTSPLPLDHCINHQAPSDPKINNIPQVLGAPIDLSNLNCSTGTEAAEEAPPRNIPREWHQPAWWIETLGEVLTTVSLSLQGIDSSVEDPACILTILFQAN